LSAAKALEDRGQDEAADERGGDQHLGVLVGEAALTG
jgi:hypothetical protein